MDDTYVLDDGKSVRVLHDQVLVRFQKMEEKTAGGIIIPESAQDHIGRAEILAFGELRKKKGVGALDVKKGDIALVVRALAFQGANPGLQKDFGDDMAVIKPEDIIGVED